MSRTVKYLTAGLILSLAVNLLVVGMIVGTHLAAPARHRGEHPQGAAVARADMATGAHTTRFLADAPPEMRPYLKKEFAGRKEDIQRELKAIRDARREVAATLRAENFDRAATEAALERLRALTLASQQAMHEALLAAYGNAPPEARATAGAQWGDKKREPKRPPEETRPAAANP